MTTKICGKCGKPFNAFFFERYCTTCSKEMELELVREDIQNGKEPDTGSSDYVICPYCGCGIETDAGYADFPELYIEGAHYVECPECERTFEMRTNVSYYYETKKIEEQTDG